MADVRVRNIAEVNASLRKFSASTRIGIMREFVPVAKTVASGSQSRALTRIPRMTRSPQWSAMRVGILSRVVYVAPVQRGRKRGPQKRKNFAPLMLNRAMRPALQAAQPQVIAKANTVLSRTTGTFNRGSL